MLKKKEIFVTAFALFSLFFGAGNLILPSLLGFNAGNQWLIITIGFSISAVIIPILGILAHAKLQGTLIDFGKKISPTFSVIYAFLIYSISITLPSPRTASVTHEMAIQPFWDISSWFTSSIYFGLVLVFAMNRSKILGILGKILTPAIILILLLVIGITVFSFSFDFGTTTITSPFTNGILEGYQTFDAIGAVVVGGVIIISINLRHKNATYEDKKSLIRSAGWLAGLALFLIYLGLILSGALVHDNFDANTTRTALLSGLTINSLGTIGNFFLSILVGVACFTTAVGIVTGTADFVRSRFNDSQLAYTITAITGSILGVLMGQFNVGYIIAVALPALMFIYPITIILILLNVTPEKYASPLVFRAVTIVTFIFSIPDFLGSINTVDIAKDTFSWIPLQPYSLGWVLPAFLVFVITNVLTQKKPNSI
ncbi:branched-chain amino acid transport system II carrier protein [Maribacter hydrothermalis]|uniref:Branched-chain amino acid ABC transporter substrate-binding protein n=1 Tax=Maribacter hydrothermalis TaxID=1836467 RepID=A0A1B7ZED3_9FLAO|nr:branched-chain amino acid transport system II carrier protein [Maribacter hydrothermalis]APQ17437.1 branched-chain amino acid ABC transporter substrate-binding protein [Maribacter hydrothermalis]OBR41916.1 branched-chain amino acid ABC transporter substrate-binding protein [Maribacter hydrothermalis]